MSMEYRHDGASDKSERNILDPQQGINSIDLFKNAALPGSDQNLGKASLPSLSFCLADAPEAANDKKPNTPPDKPRREPDRKTSLSETWDYPDGSSEVRITLAPDDVTLQRRSARKPDDKPGSEPSFESFRLFKSPGGGERLDIQRSDGSRIYIVGSQNPQPWKPNTRVTIQPDGSSKEDTLPEGAAERMFKIYSDIIRR